MLMMMMMVTVAIVIKAWDDAGKENQERKGNDFGNVLFFGGGEGDSQSILCQSILYHTTQGTKVTFHLAFIHRNVNPTLYIRMALK